MVVRIYSRALFAILYFFVGILICHLARAETVTPNKLITDTDHIELDNFYCWSDSDPEWPHHYDEPACIEKANGRVFRDSQNNLVVKGKNNNAIKLFKPASDSPEYLNACDNGPCDYLFVGFSKNWNSYLIFIFYYEDYGFIFVDKDELFSTNVGDIPKFSKNNRELITVSDTDIYDRHLLRVFNRERSLSGTTVWPQLKLEMRFKYNIEFEKWIDDNSFSILIWDNPSLIQPDGTVKPGRRLKFGRLYGSWTVKNSEDLSMK